MPNPIVHFEIVGSDSAKTQQFYTELFDWTIDSDNPMGYGVVNTGSDRGIGGGIFGVEEEGDRTGVKIYIEVDDLQTYLDKAEQLGGKTILPPTVIPDMVTFALFADPDGTLIGLVKGE
ncbi:MAG: VOC family protein [Chloroflexi bacterium]|nr:VOC family protein [Chloroflexota bacterium]